MNAISQSITSEQLQERYAYSYQRWSSPLQTLGSSKDRQDMVAQSVCDKLGLKLLDTIRDEGISAKDGDNLKENFASLGRVVKRGEYVIIEEWSRISRAGKRTTINAVGDLVDKGINVVVAMGDDGEPIIINQKNFESDRVWDEISSGAAGSKKENDRLTKKKKQAWDFKKEAIAKGTKVRIYRPPPWIHNTPKDVGPPDYIVNYPKAELVERVFLQYAKGLGVHAIAQHLNLQGVQSIYNNGKLHCKQGRAWQYSSVKKLLRDSRVIGYYKGVNPPVKIFPKIVEEVLFWKCNHIMDSRASNKTYSGPSAAFVNVFNGLCHCCKCNSSMRVKSKVSHRYLKCGDADIHVCNEQVGVRLNKFERSFQEMLGRMDLVHTLLNKEEDKEPSRIPQLEKQLEQCALKRQRIYDILKQLDEPPTDIKSQIEKSVREEKRIVTEIDAEKTRLQGSTPVKEALETYKEKFLNKWNDPDARLQIRELLRSSIDKIVIDTTGKPKKYSVSFKGCPSSINVIMNYHDFVIEGMPPIKYTDPL